MPTLYTYSYDITAPGGVSVPVKDVSFSDPATYKQQINNLLSEFNNSLSQYLPQPLGTNEGYQTNRGTPAYQQAQQQYAAYMASPEGQTAAAEDQARKAADAAQQTAALDKSRQSIIDQFDYSKNKTLYEYGSVPGVGGPTLYDSPTQQLARQYENLATSPDLKLSSAADINAALSRDYPLLNQYAYSLGQQPYDALKSFLQQLNNVQSMDPSKISNPVTEADKTAYYNYQKNQADTQAGKFAEQQAKMASDIAANTQSLQQTQEASANAAQVIAEQQANQAASLASQQAVQKTLQPQTPDIVSAAQNAGAVGQSGTAGAIASKAALAKLSGAGAATASLKPPAPAQNLMQGPQKNLFSLPSAQGITFGGS